jgi:hypothetical protein
MNDSHTDEIAEIRRRLADGAYRAWRQAECETERLLHTWFAAAGPGEGPAYLAYRAALDREEAAALALVPYRGTVRAGSVA